jgi:hypothetical protein
VARVLFDAGSGVDLAYMDNREFEFDADARSANRIATAASRLKIVTQALATPNYNEDVHFVCTAEQAEQLLPEWHKWAKHPESSIEPTGYIRDNTVDSLGNGGDNVVGWWALNEDLIWTRDAVVAENIMEAFVNLTQPANLEKPDPPLSLVA